MKYKKLGKDYFLSLPKGKEIILAIQLFAEEEVIKSAAISGIGAAEKIETAFFDPTEKRFHKNSFSGSAEIVSLVGNITAMEDKPYIHCHAVFSRRDGSVFGGHLNSAIVSAACEITIICFDVSITRNFNSEIGLNVVNFGEI